MSRSRTWTWAMAIMAGALMSACRAAPSDEHVVREPVTLEAIDGTELSRLSLTEGAADRLDIQTDRVRERGKWTVVPAGAVLVDPTGVFWVYTNPESLVFVRHKIVIDHEDGNDAFLTEGPPTGTEVVTVGAAELYGAESGVGH